MVFRQDTNLKEKLEEIGITQTQVAMALDVRTSAVSAVVNGRTASQRITDFINEKYEEKRVS